MPGLTNHEGWLSSVGIAPASSGMEVRPRESPGPRQHRIDLFFFFNYFLIIDFLTIEGEALKLFKGEKKEKK